MSGADDMGSESPKANANKEADKSRLSSSPQLPFPSMNHGRGPSPQPGGSTSGRHSHSRSKSVNLSPTISSASGSTFPSNAMRWDGYVPDASAHLASAAAINLPSSSRSHHLSTLASGNGLSQGTSPTYINILEASPASADQWRASSSYPTSESGSSEGSSPEFRKGLHFAKSMERSASGGSLYGSGSTSRLAPSSPRSSFRRTASPSRAFAVPISPRLQAFGAGNSSSGHARKLSGGSLHHAALGESLLRPTSPLHNSSTPFSDSGNATDLPIDSIWPVDQDGGYSVSTNGTDMIPIGASRSQTTPIPPSLREDLAATNMNNGYTAIPYPGPSSPTLSKRSLSSSPQDQHFFYRDQRTPSPSSWGSKRGGKKSPTLVGILSPSSPKMQASSYAGHQLPALAAPKAISKRTLDLDPAFYTADASSRGLSPRTRSLSNSASELDLGSNDTVNDSPTRKALSPPGNAQTKLDAQHAIAQVSLSAAAMSDAVHDASNEGSNGSLADDEGDLEQSATSAEVQGTSSPSSSLSSLESTKAIASAHGIPYSNQKSSSYDPAAHRHNNAIRGSVSGLPYPNGNMFFVSDGQIFRSKSPATGSSGTTESLSLGESPPKTRSFIGMPPRSGYELSDDPDDVGSEDGSTGSGRESVGTNEDRENDDEEEDPDEDQTILEDGKAYEGEEADEESPSHPQPQDVQSESRNLRAPTRPGLTQSNIVAPVPMVRAAVENEGADSLQWGTGKGSIISHRNDLGLTRNDDSADSDEDNEDEEDMNENSSDGITDVEGTGMEGEPSEESLSTLERIFLFAKSEMAYHRVLVSQSLADWILEVELSDAVEFVIPLLNGLACDENDVCTAFAPHLHRVMWYFFRNCPLTEDDEFVRNRSGAHTNDRNDQQGEDCQEEEENQLEKATRAKLSVAVFTPLLCALLLNSDAAIAGATQNSIVHFFAQLQGFSFLDDASRSEDDNVPEEERQKEQQQQFSSERAQKKVVFDTDTALIRDAAAREEKRVLLEEYDFGEGPRKMIMNELLHQVALAIGNLNADQTMQIRDLASGEEQEKGFDQEGNEGDAIMEEIPLTTTGPLEQGEEEEERESFQESQRSAEQAAEATLDSPTDTQDAEDTEMSLDLMQESQDSGKLTIAATTASLDNISMTMSDVEEEVAVGRMASISLLAALGAENLVARSFLVEYIVPEMIKFAADQTFFVRKEVAISIGALANCIGFDIIEAKDFLSIFEGFCNDRIWHVRQAACLSLPNLFAQVKDRDVKKRKVVEIMRIFVGDVSRNVRVAALDIIGELIYLFHEDENGVPAELVRHFLGKSFDAESDEEEGEATDDHDKQMDSSTSQAQSSNLSDYDAHSEASQDGLTDFGFGWSGMPRSTTTRNANGPSGWSSDGYNTSTYQNAYNTSFQTDPDRPLVMAYNFPAVILTLGKSHWSKLKAVHAQLCSNPSPKVRRSLAASLHEVAKIIGIESTTNDLLKIFQCYLDGRFEKEEDVKMAMLQHCDVFMEQLSLTKGLEALKVILNLWNEAPNGDLSGFASSWRLREKVVSLIPSLAKRFLLEDDEGVLVVLMQSALVDVVSSVRLQGIKIVSSLYHIFEEHDQVLADGFLGMLVDISENENYRSRVACLQCLSELCKSSLQRSSVEMLMMNRLVELSKDNVVDVRIAVAQLVSQMCSQDELYALPNSRSENFIALLRRLSHDEASLVREIIFFRLSDDDPGREAPLESAPVREEKRHLVLGPADGTLHRRAVSQSSFDGQGDATREVQSFEMDEEDEKSKSGEDSSDQTSSSGNTALNAFSLLKDGSPSLKNSTLMKRRSRNRSYPPSPVNVDADSSMFEDADEDDEEGMRMLRDDSSPHLDEGDRIDEAVDHGGAADSNLGLSEEDGEGRITIPDQNNSWARFNELSQTTDNGNNYSNFESQQGDNSFESDEGLPHHLLGVASNDSPLRQTIKRTLDDSHDQDHNRRNTPSSHSLSLESPERPWTFKPSTTPSSTSDAIHSASIAHALENFDENATATSTSSKSIDPFLAFVADKRYDEAETIPVAEAGQKSE
ncbi:hypothetical protein CBS101457_006792 [Exobasidium rhododendri]|nr:hypothetical protein CBS101457_006792 [Exobasidium rhododendri]